MTAPLPTTTAGVASLDGTRLLVLCDYLSAAPGGGAEKVAVEVSRRLAGELGAEVRLVGGVPGDQPPPILDGLTVVTAPAHDLSARLGAQLAVSTALPRLADRTVRAWRPHALVAHSLHFESSYVAAALARRHSIPLVLTAHVAGLEALPRRTRLLGDALEATAGRLLLRQATRIVAVSAAVGDHVRRRGADGRRVRVVPNGVDVDAFTPAGRAPLDPPVALFVGRLIANKGPELFLDGLRRARTAGLDVHGRFVGDGPLAADLRVRASATGLGDVVTFAGHVDDVRPELARATLLVRPSYTEGMPLAVLEAMAAGLPVLASDLAATRSLVTDGHDGVLFRTGDGDDLARCLTAVVADGDLRERLAAEGRRTAEAHSWSTCAAGTGAVIAEAIATHGDRRS